MNTNLITTIKRYLTSNSIYVKQAQLLVDTFCRDYCQDFCQDLSHLNTSQSVADMGQTLHRSLNTCLKKLSQQHPHDAAILQFVYLYFNQFLKDHHSISWNKIAPLTPCDYIHYTQLGPTEDALGRQFIHRCAVIKLNGGLGTSMGCTGPKSSIICFNHLTFLDVIAQQMDQLRADYHVSIPLLFMNSLHTSKTTQSILTHKIDYDEFQQHYYPKLTHDFLPVNNPADPTQEWYPPGHGDIFLSLYVSGMLDRLLKKGIHYIFLSNSDNLGASLDTKLLGYMIQHNKDFLMETTPKTLSDVKGGTLIRYNDNLMLLERAQVPDNHLSEFEDIHTFTLFNTNNIWVNILHLKTLLDSGPLPLPVIINKKTVHQTPVIPLPVIQLETAMGSAIGVFKNSGSVIVPRDRFLPVKKTSDLLILQSDLVDKSNICSLKYHDTCKKNGIPKIHFDGPLTKIHHYEKAMKVIPSLKNLTQLTVIGDVTFSEKLDLSGSVTLKNP